MKSTTFLDALTRVSPDSQRELHSPDSMSGDELAASRKETPFERLANPDPDDDEVDLDGIIDELLEEFDASPEAAAVEDREEQRFWADQLVRLGVVFGHGSPVLWGPGNIEEILTDLLPRKLTIESEDAAVDAVPAFRAFFRWASRVAPVAEAEAIDSMLEELEADFPAMMMDERRFGPAKSFLAKGAAAGFDMATDEGLLAFQAHYNRHLVAGAAKKRKKADEAKKRRAKMAKLSRRKNRRK